MSVIPLATLKTRLNKTTAADDAELQEMLDAAEAYYAERVSPIGLVSQPYYGGPFPRYASDIVLTDDAGNVLDQSYYQGSPYLRWDEPAGIMGHGFAPSVTITYTATMPAHHREAIVSDAAGLFSATQRGNGISGALPPGGYESGYEDRSTPVTLFPRIDALARSLTFGGVG